MTYYVIGDVAFVPSGVNIGNVQLWIRTHRAVTVACKFCGAPAGVLCSNPNTGRLTGQLHIDRKRTATSRR